jgi:hypothetical protein
MNSDYMAEFESNWNSGLLVFDTSSLLRIYEWHVEKAIELKDVLKCKAEDIWIPHQVNFEVMEMKTDVEKQNKYLNVIEKIEVSPVKWTSIRKMFKRWENHGYEEVFKSKVLEMEISGNTPEKIQTLRELADKLRNEHIHKVSIDSVYSDLFSNIGKPFSESEQKNLINEYNNTPTAPGHKDRKKKNSNAHGDYFIWKQIIKEAQESSKDIIFVTNDVKEDWFSNKELHIPRQELLEEFFTETNRRIIIISLTSFLEECSAYVNGDISELIAYSKIQDQVREIFDNWYPDMLIDKINEFIENDSTIKDEMESALDTCIDTVSFYGVNEQQFNLQDSEMDSTESEVIFNTFVDISTDFDGNAHCSSEDIELGTATVDLRVWLNIIVEKIWESEDTNRLSICDKAESIEITDIDFMGAYGEFSEEDSDDYYEDSLDNEDSDEYQDQDYDYDEDQDIACDYEMECDFIDED